MMTEYVTFLMSYKKEITRVLQSKYCGKNDAALSGRERMKDNKFALSVFSGRVLGEKLSKSS